jgi:nitroreductase
MQLWRFCWVNSAEKKAALAHACLGQSAAATAQELIVVTANWSNWRENCRRMIEALKKSNANPDTLKYYEKLIPLIYTYGPFNVIGFLKAIIFNVVGLFRPTPRGPATRHDVAMVAVKSAALACENFMLSIYSQGFACCPMEGFDAVRVNRVIGNRARASEIVMVISVGRADPQGIYGPQVRFDQSLFLQKI